LASALGRCTSLVALNVDSGNLNECPGCYSSLGRLTRLTRLTWLKYMEEWGPGDPLLSPPLAAVLQRMEALRHLSLVDVDCPAGQEDAQALAAALPARLESLRLRCAGLDEAGGAVLAAGLQRLGGLTSLEAESVMGQDIWQVRPGPDGRLQAR
jgi:hypothetical protein